MKVKRQITIVVEAEIEQGQLFMPIIVSTLRQFVERYGKADATPHADGKMHTADAVLRWQASPAAVEDPVGIGDGTGMDPMVEGIPAADGGKY